VRKTLDTTSIRFPQMSNRGGDARRNAMPEAMVNGVRIWYQETGAGEAVVQIHGAGFGHFNFATATPIISKSFRCIDFDMRGYGQSERPFQRYDMDVWADDVAGLMGLLGQKHSQPRS
jgi:pimeloyl-ACP methyl ester carboxylesterase